MRRRRAALPAAERVADEPVGAEAAAGDAAELPRVVVADGPAEPAAAGDVAGHDLVAELVKAPAGLADVAVAPAAADTVAGVARVAALAAELARFSAGRPDHQRGGDGRARIHEVFVWLMLRLSTAHFDHTGTRRPPSSDTAASEKFAAGRSRARPTGGTHCPEQYTNVSHACRQISRRRRYEGVARRRFMAMCRTGDGRFGRRGYDGSPTADAQLTTGVYPRRPERGLVRRLARRDDCGSTGTLWVSITAWPPEVATPVDFACESCN